MSVIGTLKTDKPIESAMKEIKEWLSKINVNGLDIDLRSVTYAIIMTGTWILGYDTFTKGNIIHALVWWVFMGLFVTAGAYYHLKLNAETDVKEDT